MCAPVSLPSRSESHWARLPAPFGRAHDLHQAPVTILPVAGRDTLGNDSAPGVLADMDHLGAGVRLLEVVGYRHGENSPIELSPCRMQPGYFQVMAEPVSTCVQEIFVFTVHRPRLVTKL